jgi:flagellar biosynthetic protein FlhB
MADRDQKTFPALPQKRERAREQGQIARSRDLTSAISFVAGTLFFAGATAVASRFVIGAFRGALAATGASDLPGAIRQAFAWPLSVTLGAMLVLAAAAVIGSTAQGGFVFAVAKLAPDLGRLNPLKYFERIFSAAGLVELAKSGIKIVLIGFIAWSTAKWALELAAGAHDIAEGLAALAAASRRILYWSATVGLVAAGADYAHKRYEHEAELRMTRQEFLDQLKQDEGNPQIKRAIRNARKKSFKRIRGIHQAAAATVVLTNPTHFAVALRYRRGFDQAPLVVAKGAGENALRIISIARLAAVPVMENKPLARALFKLVEVGEFIPRQFYRAIAEVLATIMRADERRKQEQGAA